MKGKIFTVLAMAMLLFAVILSLSKDVFAAPFSDNGNGTVTDTGTGLIWQQGEPGTMTWGPALSYCEGLTLGGDSGWRLPNVKELESLTDVSRYNPAIDTSYFPNANASYYWSSTTYAYYPPYAWVVHFGKGYVQWYDYKSVFLYVRCVRGGQSCSFGNLARRISGAVVTDYSTIQEAYDAESNDHILRTKNSVYCEPPIYFDDNIAVLLKGGYNPEFTSQTGHTTLNGSIIISAGTVTLENIIIY